MRFYMRSFGMTTAATCEFPEELSEGAGSPVAEREIHSRARMSLDVPPAAGT
jgi:hypothetical protein